MAHNTGSRVVDEHAVHVTSVFSKRHMHAVVDEDATIDDETLGALGYKQEFKRDFSIFESFSVSFSVLGLLPSIASTISYAMGYSGTGGKVSFVQSSAHRAYTYRRRMGLPDRSSVHSIHRVQHG